MADALIRKYVMKQKKAGDFLHSSGYAQVQSGDGVGAAGGIGRKRFETGERQFVQRYDDSSIMRGIKRPEGRAQTYTPPPKEMPPTPARPPLPPKR